MLRTLLLLLAAAAFAACAHDIAGPAQTFEGLAEGLSVDLKVEPDAVDQHAPFAVRLRVTNTTSRVVQVVTSHGCLALPHVLRDGKRIPFKGSAWGCTAAVTTHTFAPGETRSLTWEMRAELYAEQSGDVEGAPAPKGTYRVRAEFDVPPADGSGRKPFIETTLRVR